MSAAAELLGHGGHVDSKSTTKADLDGLVGLFNGNKRALGPGDFQALVDQVLRVDGPRACSDKIAQLDPRVGQPPFAIKRHAAEHAAGQANSTDRVLLKELSIYYVRLRTEVN